jgi:aquaporin Z
MQVYRRKLAAEAIGTFWLTFGGCGAAVIGAGFSQSGFGLLGVSLAFGLTVPPWRIASGISRDVISTPR